MKIEKLKPLTARKLHWSYLENHNLADNIRSIMSNHGCSKKEAAEWLISGNVPEITNCEVCGNPSNGKKWCSLVCMNKHPDHKASLKNVDQEEKVKRLKETCKKKYGVEHPLQIPHVIASLKANRKQKDYDTTKQTIGSCIDFDPENKIIWEKKCSEWSGSFVHFSESLGLSFTTLSRWFEKIEYDYTVHFPKTSSGGERELADWIENLGIQIERNKRDWNNRKEIDIFIPSSNLGIEYNGLFWHQEVDHLEKTILAKKAGIDLIHIWDKEWNEKRDIIKSMIRARLGLSKRIYARKTIRKIITWKEAKEFLNKNHLNGAVVGSKHIGLFYGNTLISVVSFGKSRWSEDIELLRYASLLNHTIVGGFSKLIKNEPEFISYCDRRFSPWDCVYSKFGEKIKDTEPGYFWTNGTDCISRYKTQKHKIKNIFPDADLSMTETEILHNHNYGKIYDCGNSLWKIN